MQYTTTATLTISTWTDIDDSDIINIAKNQILLEPASKIQNESWELIENPAHKEWENMSVDTALNAIFEAFCKAPFAERIGQAITQEAKREAEAQANALGNAMAQYVSDNMTFTN
jgi:hypothetical protein